MECLISGFTKDVVAFQERRRVMLISTKGGAWTWVKIIIIIIIMNFYSPVSNTMCHSIGHKMRIARIKIRVDNPGRWERAYVF